MKRAILLCCASAFLGALVAGIWSQRPEPTPTIAQDGYRATPPQGGFSSPTPLPSAPPTEGLLPEERIGVAVYENVNRGVVNISTTSMQIAGFFAVQAESEGAGSGSILDYNGHILTNFHVIQDAREIQVTLFDGTSYSGNLVGQDPATDVAVLKIDAPSESLFPIAIGDSSRLMVGQKVYAIGNPFGLERTMTTGIISSLNRTMPSQRTFRVIKQVIQIDAAINPGNSGGPLLNTSGQMIGMNTAIASKTGENTGVGFAIPANTIARIVPQLIESGRVLRADIGVTHVYQTEQGLLIGMLEPDSSAERAGLRGPRVVRRQYHQGRYVFERDFVDRSAADLIVGVDDEPVRTPEDFVSLIESHKPGETVTLNILRDGQKMGVPVVLETAE